MDLDLAQQLLDELIPDLERIETQSSAVLQLLKEKGLATEEEISTSLQQAGNASNVRWRAARVRIERLLTAMEKSSEDKAKAETQAERVEKPKAQAKALSTDPETSGEENAAKTADGEAKNDKKDKKEEPKQPKTNTKKATAENGQEAAQSKVPANAGKAEDKERDPAEAEAKSKSPDGKEKEHVA